MITKKTPVTMKPTMMRVLQKHADSPSENSTALTPTQENDQIQFHLLSFEGPDSYARAGGIASRVTGLSEALTHAGFETHLWFIGDPSLPGHETRGRLQLHRWCQWISHYHPAGVYDGEEGKRANYVYSLPPFLLQEVLLPYLQERGRQAVILAEEWQTVDAVLHLDWLLQGTGRRQQVCMFWNANNTFGFDRIDWSRLTKAAIVTTVSRYMRQRMWHRGVDPLVMPNGLSAEALQLPDREVVAAFRQRLQERTVLGKVARWDPDKRWLLAIETIAELKRYGWRPLLIARGGVEVHGAEVLASAAAIGLRVVERESTQGDVRGLLESLAGLQDIDIISLRTPLNPEACRVLFRGADAMLVNSGHEPFGLVGLETMAVGGIACIGGTGEDYAVPGWNALLLQTTDPREFRSLFQYLHTHPVEMRALRRHGRLTVQHYTWQAIIQRNLLPCLAFMSNSALPALRSYPDGMRQYRSVRGTTEKQDPEENTFWHDLTASAYRFFPPLGRGQRP